MEDRMRGCCDYELLGQVLDGTAVASVRRRVLLGMAEPSFGECFMTALRAVILFYERDNGYERNIR